MAWIIDAVMNMDRAWWMRGFSVLIVLGAVVCPYQVDFWIAADEAAFAAFAVDASGLRGDIGGVADLGAGDLGVALAPDVGPDAALDGWVSRLDASVGRDTPLDAAFALDIAPLDTAPALDIAPLDAALVLDIAPALDAALALDIAPLDAAPALDIAPLDAALVLDIAPLDAARDVIDMFQITLEATPYPPAPTSAPTSAPMIRPSSMPAPSSPSSMLPAPSSMPAPSPAPSSMPAPSPAPSATLKPGQGQLLGVLFALEPPRPDAEALRDARARALTIYQGCLNGRCALPPPQPVEDPDLEEAAMALDPGQLGWVRAKAGFYVFRALGWSWGFTLEGLRARLDPEIAAQLKAALDEGEGPLDWAILEAAGLLLSVEPFTLDADALPYALRAPLATLPLDAASAPLTLDGADYVLLPSRRALHPAKDRLFAQARLVPFFDSGSGDSAANLSRARLEAARAQLKAGLPFEALVAASADARSRRLGGRLGRVGFEAPLAAMRPGDLRVMAAPEGLWLLYLAPEAAQGASP